MRYGRTLVTGLGWAGTLGGLALCVLICLSAYLAFDHYRAGGKPREGEIVRLHSVPEAEVPRVRLGRPRQAGEATRDTLTPPAPPAR
jgi:hypothetical protein